MFPKNILPHFPLAHKYTLLWWGFLEWSLSPPLPVTRMNDSPHANVLSFLHLALPGSHAGPTHVRTPRMFIWPRIRRFSLRTCQTKMGIFQVCNYTLWVQAAKLLGWHPQNPNLTLPAHPISTGNKAKPFRQIWNKHIQTFCLSHLGTTNGFSSYRRLKIYAYLHQHPFLFPNITFILPAVKCSGICPRLSSRN